MKCWKCGNDNANTKFCQDCGASLIRQEPVSDYGKALRKIFDDFGYEKVFNDSRYITSALGDLVSDSESFSRCIEYTFNAGIGKIYESQIRNYGQPDQNFYKRVNKLFTEEAFLSQSKAIQFMGYFDEMIGWTESINTIAGSKLNGSGNAANYTGNKPVANTSKAVERYVVTQAASPAVRTSDTNPVIRVGSSVSFGSYWQNGKNDTRKEPIKWIVVSMDGNRILVISKNALDCQPYNIADRDVTWETCSLRNWLNSTFLNNAFSYEQRKLIQSVKIDIGFNSGNNSQSGITTVDKVFLLSAKEAEMCFSSIAQRSCQGSSYCIENMVEMSGVGKCLWWLRSPGYYTNFASYVDDVGVVSKSGRRVNDNLTVRPAMWINLYN